MKILPPRRSDYMLPLLANAWDHGIVTVVSGGNRRDLRYGDRSPQRYGREDNPLITVASVSETGTRSPFNSLPGISSELEDLRLVGSTTVYAQGEEVKTAKAYGNYKYSTGASFAAPQVAGLAAYFMGLPGSRELSPMEMKEKIVSVSRWQGAIDAAGLIYNGVRELALQCPPTNTRKSRRRAKEASVREEMEEKIAQRNALWAPPKIPIPPKKTDSPLPPPPHDAPADPKPPQPPSSPPKVPSPPQDPVAPLQFPGASPEDPDISLHTCKRTIVHQ